MSKKHKYKEESQKWKNEFKKLAAKYGELTVEYTELQIAVFEEGFKIQRMIDDETGLIKLKLYK